MSQLPEFKLLSKALGYNWRSLSPSERQTIDEVTELLEKGFNIPDWQQRLVRSIYERIKTDNGRTIKRGFGKVAKTD